MQEHGTYSAADMQGAPSGISTQLLLTWLLALERLYVPDRGAAIGDLVHAVSEPIDARIRQAFTGAITAVRALGGPLEVVARSDLRTLSAALTALRKLELAIKVDLANALGVTLTFLSGDGD